MDKKGLVAIFLLALQLTWGSEDPMFIQAIKRPLWAAWIQFGGLLSGV